MCIDLYFDCSFYFNIVYIFWVVVNNDVGFSNFSVVFDEVIIF